MTNPLQPRLLVALTALLIFVALPLRAEAQVPPGGSIFGTVLVAGSERPMQGATLFVVGTRYVAVADSLGRFHFEGVPAGRYEVEARTIGMGDARIVATVRPGEATMVQLAVAGVATELAGVRVVGKRADALARLPGSATVVQPATIAAIQPMSANDVLRTVPGVHLQEEEGAGMRANIGIRGLDPDRSRTVLVLEDGVPVALAPYGEPEMYYSPPIDRMERIEVLKGSGSILFGPQTIGGVVNYVTADAPAQPEGSLTVQGGTGGSQLARVRYGGTWGNASSTAGLFRKRATDINGLHFDITDFTGKLGMQVGGNRFGAKLSVYDEGSNSTYLGLTDSLYRAAPHSHPSPTDHLAIRRYALTGTHEIGTAALSVRTSVYGYQTTRDWMRRDYTYNQTSNDIVLRNTTGNRNRSFEVVGIEPRVRALWSIGGVHSELEGGIRAHVERARDQHINGTTSTSSTGEIRDDERRTGRALAGFVQNRFHLLEGLQVTPGIRVERFTYDRNILRTRVRRVSETGVVTRNPEDVDIRSGDSMLEVIPGLGAAWSPSPVATLFAGAHRGFAPPRVKDALIYEDPTLSADAQVPAPVSLQLDAEHSWNYEAGVRLHPAHFLSFEATAFRLDFSNQIIRPSLSSGSVAQARLANQGETRHRGVEGAVAFDMAKMLLQPFSLTAEVAYTFVDATFARERFMERAPGDTVNVAGNRLPYAPRERMHGSLTLDHPRGFVVRFDADRVGSQFADNFETVHGTANGRVGLIPSYTTYDLSAQLRVPRFESLALTGTVRNITNEIYIASRRPEGIKVGTPRLVSIGVNWGF